MLAALLCTPRATRIWSAAVAGGSQPRYYAKCAKRFVDACGMHAAFACIGAHLSMISIAGGARARRLVISVGV